MHSGQQRVEVQAPELLHQLLGRDLAHQHPRQPLAGLVGDDLALEEIAGALAFIGWRVAKDRAINLHGEDYVYESDEQRFAVIVEYLIYQLQIIDRLAAEGMLFRNCFCGNSICGPSRATILTGKHCHANGFMRNGNTFDGDQVTISVCARRLVPFIGTLWIFLVVANLSSLIPGVHAPTRVLNFRYQLEM